MKIGLFLLVPALALAGCGKSATGPAPGPTGEFPPARSSLDVSVPFGQARTVPGTDLVIGLVDVTDDQRCPLRDADGNSIACVWQGNADLTLDLSAGGVGDETRIMRSGFEPVVEYGPFRIIFFGLVPERSLDVVIDRDQYVATLRVTVPRDRQGR